MNEDESKLEKKGTGYFILQIRFYPLAKSWSVLLLLKFLYDRINQAYQLSGTVNWGHSPIFVQGSRFKVQDSGLFDYMYPEEFFQCFINVDF